MMEKNHSIFKFILWILLFLYVFMIVTVLGLVAKMIWGG